MRFAGPDAAVIAWWRWRQQATSASPDDPVMMRGQTFAEACRRCGHRVRQETEARAGGLVWRCKRCGAPWRVDPAQVLRGAVQVSRRTTSGTGRVVRVAALTDVLERMPMPDGQVYALWLVSGHPYEWVAERAFGYTGGQVPRPGAARWEARDVRRAIRRSRRWLRAELEAIGWLAESSSLETEGLGQSERDALGGIA